MSKTLGQNLNKLVVNLNAKLDKVPVAEISTELEGALKSARRTIDRVDRVIAGAPIDETVQNLASASARLDKLLADPGLHQTVDNVTDLTERLRKIARIGRAGSSRPEHRRDGPAPRRHARGQSVRRADDRPGLAGDRR